MIVIRRSLAFAVLAWAAFSTALDQPESYVRRLTPDRELEVSDFLGEGKESCAQRVAECQAEVGTAGLPYESWRRMIDTLDSAKPEDNPLITTANLRDLLTQIESIDYNEVTDTLEAIAKQGNADLDKQIESISNEITIKTTEIAKLQEEASGDNFANMISLDAIIQPAIKIVLDFIGHIFGIDVRPLTLLVDIVSYVVGIVVGVTAAIAGGPLAIIWWVINQVFGGAGLIKNLVNLLREYWSPEVVITNTTFWNNETAPASNVTVKGIAFNGVNKQCSTKLIQCSSERIFLTSMPTLVSGVFVADKTALASSQP